MKEYNQSKLFHKEGYISMKEYIEDIDNMIKNGPWKLPLRGIDRVHFYFLKFFSKFSWFSNRAYILHDSSISPAYSLIFLFLKKNGFFDKCTEGNLHFRGYYSYYIEKEYKRNNDIFIMNSQGVSEDISVAFSKAIGEIVERTVSGVGDMNKNIKNLSYVEIENQKYPVLYPPKYHRFLEVQKKKYKVFNYDTSKKIDWVLGKNLITGEDTYIPKQITEWFKEDFSVDHVFYNSTTNGSAGYFTKEGAVLRGLLEVVQRDAFLVHWLTMISPEIIDKRTLPNDLRNRIKDFELFGVTLYVFNTTAVSIPSVIIAAISEGSEAPQVCLSGGSGVTFREALDSAVREIVLGLEFFYYSDIDTEKSLKIAELEPFVASIGKIERQLYWRGKDKVEKFKWFLSGRVVSYEDICKQDILCEKLDEAKLAKCLDILKEKGEDYYPIVYYPKNKIQEELGFYITQVFIPKAFPLYLSEYFGTFDSDRLYEFALSKNTKNWKLNDLPHMFP